MKIKKIEWEGTLDFRRAHPQTWGITRTEFAEKHKIILPFWSDLKTLVSNRDQVRVLLSPITVRIYTTDSGVCTYLLEPGMLSDLASVPKKLRSIVDNDALELLLAALIHDANTSGHFLGFVTSNYIFRNMIRKPGNGSGWLAWTSWLAVSTPKGWNTYDGKTDTQIKFMQDRVQFDWSPKGR